MEVLVVIVVVALIVLVSHLLREADRRSWKRQHLLGELGPPESPLEERLLDLVVKSGFPRPVTQYGIEAGGRFYRLDFAYPRLKLAIEADGAQHRLAAAVERDRQRDLDLSNEGWATLRFSWTDVTRDRQRVVHTLVAAGVQRQTSQRQSQGHDGRPATRPLGSEFGGSRPPSTSATELTMEDGSGTFSYYESVASPGTLPSVTEDSPTSSELKASLAFADAMDEIRYHTLLLRLSRWRDALRLTEGASAFPRLPDRTLHEIAAARPTSIEALAQVPGIGDRELHQFGEDVIALVHLDNR